MRTAMHRRALPLRPLLAALLPLLAACGAPAAPAATPTPAGPPPSIGAATPDRATLGRYERVELTVDLTATYENPLDSREVALSAVFTAPSGMVWDVPGFWDGKDAWRVRFTPSETGAWRYTAKVTDRNGSAESAEGGFEVAPSERRGWLQVASWTRAGLSPRYLAYHDGTPFYGVGHCEAFTIGDARLDENGDLVTLRRMRDAGENLVVWWPHYNFTFFRDNPWTFDRVDMALIDSYIESADRLDMALVYTVWDHNLLRGEGHPWGGGSWGTNGFRAVTPKAEDFFTSEESWRWQENLYRYIIARWGYSPSIIWMTVSELDGTSGGAAMDSWHRKINEYFVKNDPYRHPTTASHSGDKWWTDGFGVTDIPQVHLYNEQKSALRMGDSVAEWTARMWQAQDRPNVVGEFGTQNSRIDLPLVHNGIWAGLASGAAITPLRWTDRGSWGRTRPQVMEQLGHLSRFVADIPFPSLDLKQAEAEVVGENMGVRALAAPDYAIVWVQDREPGEERAGVRVSISGLADGPFVVRPYDTWRGVELPEIRAEASGGSLTVELPPFTSDIALKIVYGS